MSNSEIPAHLRDALVVDGRTLAPAGAPELIKIENSRAAQAPDVDGSVEIYFEPLKLTDGRTLPLRTPIAHIDHHLTTGQADTQEITDTLEDIFIPYHYMWRILARKGQDVNLGPGTQVRASTAATIRVDRNGVSIVTPPPLKLNDDVPKAAFSPNPFYTVPPTHAPPAPRRTQSPATPPPSDSPSPEASSIP
ncbi:MAG: hypothetical protein JOZ38_00405 [Candidatus Eremiobacteraeota bacterium]|nr:hypothetical protein [Candidatus Eremiobacteraeota bacterium]